MQLNDDRAIIDKIVVPTVINTTMLSALKNHLNDIYRLNILY